MIWRMVMFQQLPPPPSPALLEGATHPHPPKWPLYLFLAVNCYVYREYCSVRAALAFKLKQRLISMTRVP